MTDEERWWWIWTVLLKKPIPWDPIPPWVKLTKEQVTKFNQVQVRLNAKLAELEAQKVSELSQIIGADQMPIPGR